MHRQGFDLQLTQYDDRGWRATFNLEFAQLVVAAPAFDFGGQRDGR
jgi:hypothetical protein